jgi:hypothetical protein
MKHGAGNTANAPEHGAFKQPNSTQQYARCEREADTQAGKGRTLPAVLVPLPAVHIAIRPHERAGAVSRQTGGGVSQRRHPGQAEWRR